MHKGVDEKDKIDPLIEDIQNKYFERLERIVTEMCKTLRTFFIVQGVLISMWILGYFAVIISKK